MAQLYYDGGEVSNALNSVTANRIARWAQSDSWGTLVQHTGNTCDLVECQCHFEIIQCTRGQILSRDQSWDERSWKTGLLAGPIFKYNLTCHRRPPVLRDNFMTDWVLSRQVLFSTDIRGIFDLCSICVVCLFRSNHIMTTTTVHLQNQLTSFSGQIQAYLCEPRIGCKLEENSSQRRPCLARGDLV